jgi:hypothetical protein
MLPRMDKRKDDWMKRLHAIIAVLFLGVTTATAQSPQSHGKATEQVVIQNEKLVANGAFLTPEGWERARKIYDRSVPFPRDAEISIMSTGGALGENWVKGDRAEVETKWTDYLGTIDSSLRFKPPQNGIPVTMTVYVFHLVYANKHTDIGANGKIIKEVTGTSEWKIEEPPIARWTTVERAVEYVSLMGDKSNDPLIKKNADKTVANLKHLRKGCGSASAC